MRNSKSAAIAKAEMIERGLYCCGGRREVDAAKPTAADVDFSVVYGVLTRRKFELC